MQDSLRGRLLSLAVQATTRALNVLSLPMRRLKGSAERLEWEHFCRVVFEPRPSDIYVASFPKSGTTWVQMICYQLVSGGDMSFRHLSLVSPWLERIMN